MNCYLFEVQVLGYGETPEEAWTQGLKAIAEQPLHPATKCYLMTPVVNEPAEEEATQQQTTEGEQS